MTYARLKAGDLSGRIIDVHSHIGFSLKAFANREFPYGESLEGIYYRQRAAGVDVNVVFPASMDLFFDAASLVAGEYRPAAEPLSSVPYAVENEMVLREVHEYCREWHGHFLPFVSADPARKTKEQAAALRELSREFRVYGLKISPVLCQSPITALLQDGRALLDVAREMNWPVLLHTTAAPDEAYSRADMAFEVIDANPDLRFCLAHSIGFHKGYLERADRQSNVWVDTSALTIQARLAHENNPLMATGSDRLDADYADPRNVIRHLMDAFPDTIVWGSDTPYYTYICRRQQADGVFQEFRLKASYEEEVKALNALPQAQRMKAANVNSLAFLFGDRSHDAR